MMDMNLKDIRELAGFGKAVLVNIRGRVMSCRSERGRRYTLVLSPAVDAYSNPQAFEIRSRGHLANQDQDVSCNCVLRGSVLSLDDFNADVIPVGLTLDLCEMIYGSEI
ncbi:single-stranded DNA-binding protein [Rugamonas apoptosis]|uniref:Single-stranded DNA-binding protein n=1 Tax=Rugamonas apoptosis TaxID=2758570 RepID=A0A7W2FDI9_9BURK|nr:single-stranded DNA-binding protein [Rugamonas apoptosis]MBA5689637.1 single-stranded DNA-binding protein [Rugamonas apoptosis]